MKQDGNYALSFADKYKLPVCNVNEEKRNFTGYAGSKQYFTLQEIQEGDPSGTTDSDYYTHKNYNETNSGYTNINKKYGTPVKGRSGGKAGPMPAGRY